jgi:hypothetical protein
MRWKGSSYIDMKLSASHVLFVPRRLFLLFRDFGGVVMLVTVAYLQLADNVGNTEERRLLKGEHGVLAL